MLGPFFADLSLGNASSLLIGILQWTFRDRSLCESCLMHSSWLDSLTLCLKMHSSSQQILYLRCTIRLLRKINFLAQNKLYLIHDVSEYSTHLHTFLWQAVYRLIIINLFSIPVDDSPFVPRGNTLPIPAMLLDTEFRNQESPWALVHSKLWHFENFHPLISKNFGNSYCRGCHYPLRREIKN